MEQAPSEVNWRPVNKHKKPGQMRLHSLQAIARGADASLFFQWRQAASGAERYHSGMLPNAGTDSRVFREIAAHGAELKDLSHLVGTRVTAQAAILLDWPSRWALGWRGKISDRLDYQRIVKAWHAALWRENITTDFASIADDLRGYDLVLAPALHVLSEADAEHLADYVEGGGHLVVGYLTGTVDEHTRLHSRGYQARALREVLGIRIEELHPLDKSETTLCRSQEFGSFKAEDWTELVHTESTGAAQTSAAARTSQTAQTAEAARTVEVLASLEDGRIAVTRNAFGAGVAWYLSVQPQPAALSAILASAAHRAGVPPAASGLPPGVEAVRRGGVTLLLNHTEQQVRAALGGTVASLEPFGVQLSTGKTTR
jgi:beta-galactosidase